MNKFSNKELLSFGWQKTKSHLWLFFLSFVLVLVIFGAASPLPPLSVILGVLFNIAIITVSLEVAGGENPHFRGILKKFKNYKVFVNYILASILNCLIVVVGLLLLVIPGIYLAIRLQFYKFLVVDKEDISPVMAIKESWNMTKGHTWNLFLFMLLIIIINILGVILFGIGLFISVPVSIIAYAMLYRKLLSGVSLAVKN